ncbi:MAG: hypothetical protein JXR52_02115 [Bacteroidales bacterium]|nr:hypothetical protein [Bacteroidales bacterium]MBN2697595.1 hypothetical protein [Bacteroidales bacterium]
MKTKRYSNVVKTVAILFVTMLFSNAVLAQFDLSAGTTSQTPINEEREGGTSTYTASGTHDVGDEFTWAVWADTPPVSITSGGVDIIDGGSGTSADPYLVNWTADLSSIDVTWAADASPGIDNTNGNVSVQKRLPAAAGSCPSPIQSWDIDFWSAATASISNADAGYCSSAPIGGSITINLTGAPDGTADGFAVDYEITAPNLEDGSGTSWDGNTGTVNSNGTTVTIPLPDLLTNLTTTDATFTITLTRMNDDFTGDGTLLDDTYVITVYATPDTGEITSTGSLTRR